MVQVMTADISWLHPTPLSPKLIVTISLQTLDYKMV